MAGQELIPELSLLYLAACGDEHVFPDGIHRHIAEDFTKVDASQASSRFTDYQREALMMKYRREDKEAVYGQDQYPGGEVAIQPDLPVGGSNAPAQRQSLFCRERMCYEIADKSECEDFDDSSCVF